MNFIFLTMSPFYDLDVHNIYADLLIEFIAHGHIPYLVSPSELKNGKMTAFVDKGNYKILRVNVGNINNVSSIEKGISTVLMEYQFIAAIKKHLNELHFDLILYSTPPVTFANVIKYLKYKSGAQTYLLLKDIFPQNAVDLGILTRTGPKALFYKYFHRKEIQLYNISEYIGCMSQANVDYLLRHNPEIRSEKVHVNPNCISAYKITKKPEICIKLRKEYGVPSDAVVFMYGGNLGRPQGIPFVVECLKRNVCNFKAFFIICGTGTDYQILEKYIKEEKPINVILLNGLPKQEYDDLLQACDVGIIFLDHRFTIPNFPSRILSYMEQSMPVLACTDKNTDMGEIITKGNFGWWCESNEVHNFTALVDTICSLNSEVLARLGNNARTYLENHYTVEHTYNTIMKHFV
ncbi:MAG: glycosyltransferase family 4 protein [Eubacteriales bacterium]|nr:glycosyltransferase family 4 protein [Eubacteriales bacterium]